MFDKFREECGVFGIFGHDEAARLTYLGLYALQHRGQESAGIVSSDGSMLRFERGMGHVNDIFQEKTLSRLPGRAAIGSPQGAVKVKAPSASRTMKYRIGTPRGR